MNYIKRAMENTFLRLAKEFPALLLTGPRQTGKTTMLQKLAAEEKIGRNYVTLDDLTERQMAKNDPKMFLQIHKPPVFIDEVQYAPELFSYIKIHIDRHHRSYVAHVPSGELRRRHHALYIGFGTAYPAG